MRVDGNYGATKGYEPNSYGEWQDSPTMNGLQSLFLPHSRNLHRCSLFRVFYVLWRKYYADRTSCRAFPAKMQHFHAACPLHARTFRNNLPAADAHRTPLRGLRPVIFYIMYPPHPQQVFSNFFAKKEEAADFCGILYCEKCCTVPCKPAFCRRGGMLRV